MTETDTMWMRRALELAELGRGWVEPNPLVGAVVVRDGHVAGEGWHQRFGQAHAEVNALAAAGEAARGATLYVTLEPCCHHGKTPPCTDAAIRAGVMRVVAAMVDPFAEVHGKGVEILRAAGVAVDVGLCQEDAERLNAPYLTLLGSGRPYVHAKWAMTLDGKLCTRSGDSKWISNEASRRRVHELRGRMDGIIVGIGTVLADDPLLTARPPGPRTPARIVLDRQCRLPASSQLVRTIAEAPVMVVTVAGCSGADALRSAGCAVLEVPALQGRPSVVELLDALGRQRMTNVLVEGGAEVLGSFFDAAVVDEWWAFVAPRIVGGAGKSPVGGSGAAKIIEGLKFAESRVETMEEDVLIWGRT
jgi:diaminohydroxyphosphoribosylaminopyrimidine deaminase/5-amino-6-(5-phosphoribosylamino)uracil reductase